MFAARFCAALLAGLCVVSATPALAQTSAAANATPMQPGPNRGGADSFQGDHLWYFMAQPGTFQLTLRELGQSMDSVPLQGRIQSAIQLVPSSPKSHYTTRKTPGATVWTGSVDKPTKVYILIEPPKSALVRIAVNYELEATGQVAFGGGSGAAGGAGGDPVVGTYTGPGGGVRFLPDGRIQTTDGQGGQWSLFDPATQLYSIMVGGGRYTARLIPGRGLVDARNDYVIFTPVR
jgi:hypothetical protein